MPGNAICSPMSSIEYICEINPTRTRKPEDEPFPEDGLGNHEYNIRRKDWDRFHYAYRVRSVRRLKESIRLTEMKEVYGMNIAPRSLVYVYHLIPFSRTSLSRYVIGYGQLSSKSPPNCLSEDLLDHGYLVQAS